MKNKKVPTIVKAIAELMNSGQKPPHFIWADKGLEFHNKLFRTLLADKTVHLYWIENEEKSSIIELWNRTVKRILWKSFTKHRTGTYYTVFCSIRPVRIDIKSG